jgi:NADH:ubiquinone oxidoreductase subunit 6 (subunit J)
MFDRERWVGIVIGAVGVMACIVGMVTQHQKHNHDAFVWATSAAIWAAAYLVKYL